MGFAQTCSGSGLQSVEGLAGPWCGFDCMCWVWGGGGSVGVGCWNDWAHGSHPPTHYTRKGTFTHRLTVTGRCVLTPTVGEPAWFWVLKGLGFWKGFGFRGQSASNKHIVVRMFAMPGIEQRVMWGAWHVCMVGVG